jgi:hypothetical protein
MNPPENYPLLNLGQPPSLLILKNSPTSGSKSLSSPESNTLPQASLSTSQPVLKYCFCRFSSLFPISLNLPKKLCAWSKIPKLRFVELILPFLTFFRSLTDSWFSFFRNSAANLYENSIFPVFPKFSWALKNFPYKKIRKS